ncbi:hypothetical protein ACE40D_14215 [Enterococcus avium]|uniref:hypothetical protein n=1 Tax=Enterococcus avium TaxID=33945 RepID=UPI0035CBF910
MEENITIEFVKEWIDKHNLTKDSFDRIMNDLIYNSGHNYIDNPYLRYWLIDNTYKFRDMLPVKLNDDQQIVLNYLIKQAERCSDVGYLAGDLNFFASTDDGKAWAGLTEKERYQVLAAFAEWGMKEVAE